MDINGTFEYELSGYEVTIEVAADENGVYVRNIDSVCFYGAEAEISDEEIERLTADLDATLDDETREGEWAEAIAEQRDGDLIADDSGTDPVANWAPQLRSMPQAYQVH